MINSLTLVVFLLLNIEAQNHGDVPNEGSCRKGEQEQCVSYLKSLYKTGNADTSFKKALEYCSDKMIDVCLLGATFASYSSKYDVCVSLLNKRCSPKSPYVCAVLSDCLFEINKIEESLEPARVACDNGAFDACSTVSAYYLSKEQKGEALVWAKKGCEKGSAMSCGAASALYISDGEYKEALELGKKGCEFSDRNACKAAAVSCERLKYGCELEYYERCCKMKDRDCCHVVDKKSKIIKKEKTGK